MIPFSPPRIDQRTIDEVTDTLKSGWITTGPKTKLFEKKLTEYNGNLATACLNSATAGMELVLRWFGVGPGDEVIVPVYTYCATANVVEHCGATPVMVDVGDDFNITVANIAAKITANTKAIMPVDIGGWPCDYKALMALVTDPEVKAQFVSQTDEQTELGRILLLADAAHSLGAVYNQQPSGCLADVSVFSFHAVKNLTTAEGGAVALNLPTPFDNEAVYRQLCVSSLHGQSKDALAKMQKGGWRYDVVEAGYKCNMTDIQAAIGLVELERYESDMLKRRREIFDRYSQAFSNHPWAIVPAYENAEKRSSYHVYMLRIEGIDEEGRDAIIQEIYDRGVAVNVHFQPLPMLTYYRDRGYKMDDYPNAFRLYSSEISLPVYYNLNDEDLEKVIESVVASVESVLSSKTA